VDEFYVSITNHEDEAVGRIYKEDGKWHEELLAGDVYPTFGSKTYMSYLTPKDVIGWLVDHDYEAASIIDEEEAEEMIEELEEE
jgi:hypothetical protein